MNLAAVSRWLFEDNTYSIKREAGRTETRPCEGAVKAWAQQSLPICHLGQDLYSHKSEVVIAVLNSVEMCGLSQHIE